MAESIKSLQAAFDIADKNSKAKGGANKGLNDIWAAAKAKLDDAKAVKKDAEEIATLDDSTVSNRVRKALGPSAGKDIAGDVAKGSQFGEAVIGKEGLGRLGQDPAVAAMEAQAAELAKGFSSEENLARQEKGIEGIGGTAASQSRQLQASLARSGVKGQAAGFQLGGIAQSSVEARGNLERDLIIANQAAQVEGLGIQSGIVGMRQAQEQFDISQAAKEKDIALQSGLGFAQLGVAERGGSEAAAATIRAAEAGKQKSCFLHGTKIKMLDGSIKNIENIQVADFLEKGDVVYMVTQGLVSEIYEYGDIMVATGHAVLENGKWLRVENSKKSIKHEGIFPVYNLANENHRIVTECGTIFADFDETDLGSNISNKDSLEALNGKGSKVLEGRRGV